ncbi:MAG: thrombospondin type 3 repeat-containing protein, partial [Polyangiaceae bacterium]|nr:thrombospondin type 3 repeat-containing protein [Polyangiaceae bacterium]
ADQSDEVEQDGVGDACDDTDEDGIVDAVDNCPEVENADQADANENGVGDACDETGTGGAGGMSSGTGGRIDGTLGGSGCSCRIEESKRAGGEALWLVAAGVAALVARGRHRKPLKSGRSGSSPGRRSPRRAVG